MSRRLRPVLVDATQVSEPGATGTTWRIHYSLNLRSLHCDSFRLTRPEIGESLRHLEITPGTFLIWDRAYCSRAGIEPVLDDGAEVLIRYRNRGLPLQTRRGNRWQVVTHLSALSYGVIGDWDVWFRRADTGAVVKGRCCAIKKSREAAERAVKAVLSVAKKKGRTVRPSTLVLAEYVIVLTTVDRRTYSSRELLDLYRLRWQIELVFRRFKGIVGLGHLPKYDRQSCVARLYGKLFVAQLMERLAREADAISPWGYPI